MRAGRPILVVPALYSSQPWIVAPSSSPHTPPPIAASQSQRISPGLTFFDTCPEEVVAVEGMMMNVVASRYRRGWGFLGEQYQPTRSATY